MENQVRFPGDGNNRLVQKRDLNHGCCIRIENVRSVNSGLASQNVLPVIAVDNGETQRL